VAVDVGHPNLKLLLFREPIHSSPQPRQVRRRRVDPASSWRPSFASCRARTPSHSERTSKERERCGSPSPSAACRQILMLANRTLAVRGN
jgi:hypothetical protein